MSKAKIYHFVFSTLLVSLLFVGCERSKIARELRSFMSTTVTIPDGLVKVERGNSLDDTHFGCGPFLVIYHGPEECSTCILSNNYTDCSYLKRIESTGKCEVLVIIAPHEDDTEAVLDFMRSMNNDFPLYLDQFGNFELLNRSLPVDIRFHSFLLDENRHPV